MIKRYFYLLAGLIFSLNLKAQISTTILNEEFLNNQNAWEIYDTPEGKTDIENGKFFIEGKMLGKAVTATIPVLSEGVNDFKISAEITKLSGIDDNGFGLVWGSADPNNEFEFVISSNGQFKVNKWENGINTNLISWTGFTGINRWDNSTNRLRIEKRGAIIKFYINDYYVSRIAAQENFGPGIGFVVNETIKIAANYLILEKIEEKYHNETLSAKAFIQSASFNGSNELRYQESAVLKVIVANPADHSEYDLALMVSSFDDTNIEYNRITMIEKIPANDKAIIAIVFTADEEIQTKARSFELNLVDSKNNVLDTKHIVLKTVQHQFYSEYSAKEYNYQSGTYTPKVQKNSPDGCTKGCTYASFGFLLVSIILAVI